MLNLWFLQGIYFRKDRRIFFGSDFEFEGKDFSRIFWDECGEKLDQQIFLFY